MPDKHIDTRKTYAIPRNTLEAIGIELVIASKEYEKRLLEIAPDEKPLTADQVFYNEQIVYLDGLIKHLHEVTNNELLLI